MSCCPERGGSATMLQRNYSFMKAFRRWKKGAVPSRSRRPASTPLF
ncbi:MAG: hypothetical protein AVDCRST_MAG25-194 [uncultured Rubrobacteraceae bacterium]|uniref:Uncharacterized protein n=1 Tax=uncultured Rubrobacteraceae bacterium TaxID=349277 RepID=A0A6J4QVV2_9ACTN|nr:MAG: hypothetical protein AVDCRST_MAG25-194 [uncultured Rubrobacteraceae bacterium]